METWQRQRWGKVFGYIWGRDWSSDNNEKAILQEFLNTEDKLCKNMQSLPTRSHHAPPFQRITQHHAQSTAFIQPVSQGFLDIAEVKVLLRERLKALSTAGSDSWGLEDG